MTTTNFNVQNEGYQPLGYLSLIVITIPNGARMIIYLQSIDYDLWLCIENGPHKPTKIENDIMVLQSKSEYINGDKKLLFMDVKGINTLYCALIRS
jgi:hypothetical protein